jgi:hypothetical protein
MEHLRPRFGLCSEIMTVMCRLWITPKEDQFANVEAEAEVVKPAPNDFLQRWPVSKRVNSSKAYADDATLIERVELAAAQDDLRQGLNGASPSSPLSSEAGSI